MNLAQFAERRGALYGEYRAHLREAHRRGLEVTRGVHRDGCGPPAPHKGRPACRIPVDYLDGRRESHRVAKATSFGRAQTKVSTITLFDGLAVADFDGLPASASRWL